MSQASNGGMNQKIFTQTLNYPTDSLIWLFEKVANEANKRNKNYYIDEEITSYTLCYTLSTVNDVPYLGSLAWLRPLYDGMVRVASRYCVNPDLKYFNMRYSDCIRKDAIDHINQQVEFTRCLGYNDHFISREDRTLNARNTKRILNKLNENSPYLWKMSKEKQRVAPNPVTGWQWVIYNNKEYVKKEI